MANEGYGSAPGICFNLRVSYIVIRYVYIAVLCGMQLRVKENPLLPPPLLFLANHQCKSNRRVRFSTTRVALYFTFCCRLNDIYLGVGDVVIQIHFL